MKLINIFYFLKPIIPRNIQIALRRKIVNYRLKKNSHIWPIYIKSNSLPNNWVGWPKGKKFAFVLTHDVDTCVGQEKCFDLMQLEKRLGFRSAFYFVPERYSVNCKYIKTLGDNGFEVGVHGLCHDGKLYKSQKIFQERAKKINHYLKNWQAVGFRSPAMHRELSWLQELNIRYDASTFDTDPFEPNAKGVKTIFPFFVREDSSPQGYYELPYTLVQDFTLFILLRETTIDIWKQKLDWIAENGGMALLITHPDYMKFNGKRNKIDQYPASYYEEFLTYVKQKYEGQYWHALPRDVTSFCSNANIGSNKICEDKYYSTKQSIIS
jgi:hypothetical protein